MTQALNAQHMQIDLKGVGKKFRKEWIFRNLSLQFKPLGRYALVGHNGSGKSTLLQVVAGVQLPSEGEVAYTVSEQKLDVEQAVFNMSYSAPYQELIEELTAEEMFDFHFRFRRKQGEFSSKQFFEEIELLGAKEKMLKYFSSGMKQRFKLALCAYTEAQMYLFDEPTTNLDRQGVTWYKMLLNNKLSNKTLIISSNVEEEYEMCDQVINLLYYK
jgi:ABC-type multidrug transport system ATPase subunit